ncbi:hypothetical protein [Halalkalibacter nanhaiisediminis]|uniref:Uncharacterized protein n=1 Tax=Halalkalibacter nanhaiisediminis TaxID=688079 RepID=A0A562QRI3_9BACI|nr:hypothetical protein [Halalkalibacter nanhaiisediminis]TWI59334.1 hypothetical protein IQ10_01050 [Halalkalibacter nanhaiisediminis]
MQNEEIETIIQQLRKKEIDSYRVKKTDFLDFRAVIVAQEDNKDFRGNAQHGGETIYTYEPGWSK